MKLTKEQKAAHKAAFRTMSPADKLDYIMSYYKWPILLAAILLLILGSAAHRQLTKKEPVIYLALADVVAGEDLENALTEGFLRAEGANPGRQEVYLYRDLYLSDEADVLNHEYAYASRMKLMGAVQAQKLDVVLMNIVEETYKWVKENIKERKIVLYATAGTYHSGVYHKFFDPDGEFQIVEPEEADRKLIWEAIYNRDYGIKACSNPITDQAVENFRIVTEKMLAEGYSTFIMGCTEIPLAMGRLRLPVTKIDPAKILARALIKEVCPEKLKA